ncbi:MAG: hypothetical protein PHG14_11155 [Desulfobacter postgatei]|uniref:hypothetical protein n=1 Tax=Desulfobacter postgatei TaxID=2293 RepID=UPI0023F56C80|nr:hypothetical protein [Desulfobacter postgatei]MDD4274271.1 hypothetical protein [Desulfobacter postgatei]
MNLALKVRTDAKRQIPEEKREKKKKQKTIEDKQRQAAFFNSLYTGRNMEFSFKTMEEVSMTKHFYFPKLGEDYEDWSFGAAPLAAFAVYPVICSRVDFRNHERWMKISMEEIAKKAGHKSVSTTSNAIKHLIEAGYGMTKSIEGEIKQRYPLIERKKVHEKVPKGEKRVWEYRAGFIRGDMIKRRKTDDEARYFKFPTWIIDTGLWAKLKPRAKALYIALRSCSRFDEKLYAGLENGVPFDQLDQIEFDLEEYKARKWEVCNTPTTRLCRMVNIDGSDIRKIVDDLEETGLVEKIDRWWKVWLMPNPDKNTTNKHQEF